jgi:hypothetical protein
MRSLSILGFLLFFLCCSGTNNHLKVISVDNRLNDGQNSCSGRGVISSTGNFSGKLSFSFLVQNDSSFCQFQDFLGRKVLLLWLTPNSVEAWNLIENKKYSHANISEIIPVLSILDPLQIIKFIWGKEISQSDLNLSNLENVIIKIEEGDLNKSQINKAIFTDNENRHELAITIKSRVHSKEVLNLKKYWELILS